MAKSTDLIDISHWQTVTDWKKVAGEVDSIFIKVSTGTGPADPNFLKNANAASLAGMKIGYYHFATLNNADVINDATAEANFFVSKVKSAPKNSLPLVLDLEENHIGLNPDKVLLWIQVFFHVLEQAGYSDYLLYSNTPFLNANLPTSHNLGNVRLFIAAYSTSYKIPNGWKKAYLWQYTEKGKVDGINGNVDRSKYL